MNYCNSLFSYARFRTREVMVGELGIGAHHPIRIQSMTTTNTLDIAGTSAQSIRMIRAGAELVRITAPGIKEARCLEQIKKEIRKAGYSTPLVADIHFTPNAAEIAARLVEKVRINPGNYADKKKFEEIEYNDRTYAAELERIRDRFVPLVRICRDYGTAMRIGTNHGSLSDRILSRYGDTPLGMVESAMEFLRICEAENFRNIILSMKASNPQVMVQAYRLLVQKMILNGQDYPLHLGVTEAGEGEDGRIKSAVGIGTLLEDGLGDTIRVSLTEEPEAELPVAKALVNRYKFRTGQEIPPIETIGYDPLNYSRRQTKNVMNIGGKHPPVVVADLRGKIEIHPGDLLPSGYAYVASADKWNISEQAADYLIMNNQPAFHLPGALRILLPHAVWKTAGTDKNCFPYFTSNEFLNTSDRSPVLNVVFLDYKDHFPAEELKRISSEKNVVLAFHSTHAHTMPSVRRMFMELFSLGSEHPVVIASSCDLKQQSDVRIHHSILCGALFLDGMGDGVLLNADADPAFLNSSAFGILQATRTRISKTEYISCPSCGRTLFNLQETTAKIRERTSHLKGVKIGIMGCIVNGPGEMADADYGYVGTGPGKITLYKGKEVIKRNIDADIAVEALINLIRENGDWIEKKDP